MKDADGTIWHMVRVTEHDRDALTVARRLAMNAVREHDPSADVWKLATCSVDPRAVLINLDRMAEDWDNAAEDEA